MFRNANSGRGQGRGAGQGQGQGLGRGAGQAQGLGQGGGAGAGLGRGRGATQGQGRGLGQQPSNWGEDARQNQSLSSLSAGIPASEKKSWLQRFKTHLIQRMSEVDEELNKY